MNEPSGLDLLTVLDILKNEDLYRKRLEDLNKATKSLADQQWMTATLDQIKVKQEEIEKLKSEFIEWKDNQKKIITSDYAKLKLDKEEWEADENLRRKYLMDQTTKLNQDKTKLESEVAQLQKDRAEFQVLRNKLGEDMKSYELLREKYIKKITAIQDIINAV